MKNAIDQFIIEVSLIDPIQKIINQLNNGEFRDCDLKWLDKKLENFVEFAAKTLNVNGIMPQRESVKPACMNDYAFNYYSKYFNQLLDYFKSCL
jgi:hypothetical protein